MARIMGVREARATLTAKVSKLASDHARKVTGVSDISEEDAIRTLLYWCGATVGDLKNTGSSVFIKESSLNVGGVTAFPVNDEGAKAIAACVAAHAVFFLPFKGPCKDVFALIYVSWGFVIPLKKSVQRLKEVICGDGW